MVNRAIWPFLQRSNNEKENPPAFFSSELACDSVAVELNKEQKNVVNVCAKIISVTCGRFLQNKIVLLSHLMIKTPHIIFITKSSISLSHTNTDKKQTAACSNHYSALFVFIKEEQTILEENK